MTKEQTDTTPDAALRALAERMARENDVNVRDAEYALRRMIANGLICVETSDAE